MGWLGARHTPPRSDAGRGKRSWGVKEDITLPGRGAWKQLVGELTAMKRPICESITGGRWRRGRRSARVSGRRVEWRGAFGEGSCRPAKRARDDLGVAVAAAWPRTSTIGGKMEGVRRPACSGRAVRRTMRLRAGCQQPVRRYVVAIEVTDALRPEPLLYQMRGHPGIRCGTQGSKAQPLHRITQPNCACPSWETVRRARLDPMRPVPGRGPYPPGFSAGIPGKSLTTESIIAGPQAPGKGSDRNAYCD